MQTTDNYELNLYEGTDKFNPLLVENVNSEKIDEVLGYLNSRVVDTATEIKNGSVHAITRANGESATFRFTATANWTSGDTITVDGIQVSAFLTSGEALGTNAYVIGTEVLCNLVGTRLTVYCVSGTVTEADNALKLGGQLPSYYGTAEAVTSANALATAANQISIANQGEISQLNSDLAKKQNKTWTKFNASSPVNLTTYSEIMVVLGTSLAGVIVQAIPTCILTSSYTLFQLGAGSVSNGVSYGANIKNNGWASATPYVNGAATTYSKAELYYR